ncbi:MAG: ATP-grasp domain-containing protein [Chloroflexi bacterium]|nr:ATP-grasp domain-containing protein [Chloroflexota bacterium]
MSQNNLSMRVLLLTTAHSYRSEAFLRAAESLGIEVIRAVDMPPGLSQPAPGILPVTFNQPDEAAAAIAAFAERRPLTAILSVDDSGALIAAQAAQALGLPHNAPEAAQAARDKYIMRQMLAAGGTAVPPFHNFSLAEAMEQVTAIVRDKIGYPCVVKPRTLNGSRGVIRANDDGELVTAVARVHRLLQSFSGEAYLVEQFIPGFEVALEGVLADGRLHVLALFDKPDPLDGPYFEETIYVTPSRLPPETQDAIAEMAERGARALGLQTGPVHAELRVNEAGPWSVEVNGRSIGGLCSRTLRFEMNMSLEELLLRQACGLDVSSLQREEKASGVMMIPIPQAGILRGYSGLEAARQIPRIDDIVITAPLNQHIRPLPEGESYLGFIFASGKTPDEVETALRLAHGHLHFQIDEEIRLSVIGIQ